MIGDVRKDVDDELTDNFFRAKSNTKKWLFWKKLGEESFLDSLGAGVWQGIRMSGIPDSQVPEKEVVHFEGFSRNDLFQARRAKLDRSQINLPALQLEFEDPDNSGCFYTGFIEGKENINKFFLALAKRHNKECPLAKILGEAKRSITDEIHDGSLDHL